MSEEATIPEAGKKYMVNGRFGRATVKVLTVDETWAHSEVVSGTLRGMGRGAVWGRGDEKTLRIGNHSWVPVKP